MYSYSYSSRAQAPEILLRSRNFQDLCFEFVPPGTPGEGGLIITTVTVYLKCIEVGILVSVWLSHGGGGGRRGAGVAVASRYTLNGD